MTGALLAFSLSALSIRGLAGTLNIFEILGIRTGFGLIVLLAIAASHPELRATLRPRRMRMHIWRNSIHFVGQYTWALAVTLLPLATVFALEFTMPMWVALLAIGSIVLGFLGVAVIVRPGLGSFQPAALLVLGAALAFAFSLIATKQLTSNVGTFAIIFWMNLLQFPMAMAGSDPLFVLRLGESTLLPALGMGIAGLASHYCLTNAFRWGDATVVVPIDFMRIPLIALLGWLIYGETVDVFVYLGAGLIICGVLWNLHAESRRPRPLVATATEKAQSGGA